MIRFKKDQREKVQLKIIFTLKLLIKRTVRFHKIGIQVHMEQQASLISQEHQKVQLMERINIITPQLINMDMDTGMDMTVEIVNASKGLKILDLSYNKIGDLGLEKILRFIKEDDCHLEALSLEGNSLGDKNITKLCENIYESISHLIVYCDSSIAKAYDSSLNKTTTKWSRKLYN